jgi:threonine dehydrogenase-like Zn-dependent dehydrogenase
LVNLRGAKKVYVVDRDARRLAVAKPNPIDVSLHEDPAEHILAIEPHSLDRGIEASGFRSTNSAEHKAMRMVGLEGDSSDTVSAVIKATRKCGNVALRRFLLYNQ